MISTALTTDLFDKFVRVFRSELFGNPVENALDHDCLNVRYANVVEPERSKQSGSAICQALNTVGHPEHKNIKEDQNS